MKESFRGGETKTIAADDSQDTSNLEPYWMFDMRKKKEWPLDQKQKYELDKTHKRISAVQNPNLVMDIAYTAILAEKTGFNGRNRWRGQDRSDCKNSKN